MKYFLGYSNNKEIRYNSSSGGVITSLLIYLLEKKKIDGALVCKMNRLRPVQYIAKSRKEIVEATQSKYLDFDLVNTIKQIKKFKGKLAVVGTPCQLMTLRSVFRKDNKIKYWFGLYCGCNLTGETIFKILKRLKISPKSVEKISFRDGKDYGQFRVSYKSGGRIFSKTISKDALNYLFTLYMPDKCLKCKDFFNEYSDISFGDCWIKTKYTSIYPKKVKMVSLLEDARKNGYISLEQIDKTKFFAQHKHSVNLKKKRLNLKKYERIMNVIPFPVLDLLSKSTKKIKSIGRV